MSKIKRPPTPICPRCLGLGTVPPKGSLLRAMRTAAGFSQGDLGKHARYVGPFISKVEHDRAACPARLYEGYLTLAGIPVPTPGHDSGASFGVVAPQEPPSAQSPPSQYWLNDGFAPRQGGKTKPGLSATVFFTERFWPAYPVKRGKPQALKALKKTRWSREWPGDDEIILAIQAYAAWLKADDTRKPLYPQGYLNNQRWLDDLTEAPKTRHGHGVPAGHPSQMQAGDLDELDGDPI